MRLRHFSFFMASVTLALAGCGREGAGCLTPLGPIVERPVALDMDVLILELEDRVDVLWDPTGTEPQALIRAGEGVAGGVSIEQADGVLRIADRNTCHWARDLSAVPQVWLSGIRPDTVHLLGQGAFTMTETLHGGDLAVIGNEMAGQASLRFAGDTLQVRMPNGAGHVDIQGRARRLRAFRSGFGDLDAGALAADQVMLHHAGVGDVRLFGPGYLYLELAGHGDVHLGGAEGDWNILRLPGATGQVIVH